MDTSRNILHNSNIGIGHDMNRYVPTYQLYGEEAAQGGDFRLHCETIPERSRLHAWEIRPHRHEAFFQMLHISGGHGEALMDGAYLPFDRDAVLFVPPGETHGFRFSRDIGGFVVTVFRDRLDGLAASDQRIAAFAGQPRMVAAAGERAALAVASLQRIAVEMAGHAIARAAMLDALVATALIDLARANGGREGGAADPRDRDAARLEQLSALIGAHFREHRPVGFYAERLKLSAAHLNRVTRARTGRSLRELIDLRLVEEAKRNLVFTVLPAQSIALALGFSDPAYFNRFFRRQTGTTPAEFRRRERERLRY